VRRLLHSLEWDEGVPVELDRGRPEASRDIHAAVIKALQEEDRTLPEGAFDLPLLALAGDEQLREAVLTGALV
jgi:hypothetical protein